MKQSKVQMSSSVRPVATAEDRVEVQGLSVVLVCNVLAADHTLAQNVPQPIAKEKSVVEVLPKPSIGVICRCMFLS